uniref:Ovule protein n=1 Tax=Heterorhabditis bacteriophora TaxID=37862 RepID=A0A1I7WCI8_HETBA
MTQPSREHHDHLMILSNQSNTLFPTPAINIKSRQRVYMYMCLRRTAAASFCEAKAHQATTLCLYRLVTEEKKHQKPPSTKQQGPTPTNQ